MDRNFKEDQVNEIEALESIYYGDFEILTADPYHKFKVKISTEEFNVDDEENGLCCNLVFTYTKNYPDTAPLVEIEDAINFEDEHESGLLEHIQKTIQEHLGIEMVFSLVSSAQEWLNVKWDEYKQDEENRRMEKQKVLEEAEMKKFEGTLVTVETFLKWRNEFERETGIAQKREKQLSDNKKLTGRELFMQDNTLNESDLKYLMEAGDSVENVKIDESLFQNLEDLDFGSDDDGDEDYVPGKNDDDSD